MPAFLSIIIPVFNIEAYLKHCVNSILEQSYSDFELILVDDGSTDHSGELCDSFAKNDNRVISIHKQNGGAASARNEGLKAAQGDYILFIDADDWIDRSLLSDLCEKVRGSAADIAIFGFFIDSFYKGRKQIQKVSCPSELTVTNENRHRLLPYFAGQLIAPPWNKFYRRIFLMERQIEFPDTYWDDVPFNLEALKYAGKIITFKGVYYHYVRARLEAETNRYRSDLYEKRLEEHKKLKELLTVSWGFRTEEVGPVLADIHIRNIWGLIVNLFHEKSSVKGFARYGKVKNIIEDATVREVADYTTERSGLRPAMISLIRKRRYLLIYLMAGGISIVKYRFPSVFNKIKRQSGEI